ncbi:Dehydrogenase/reductase SDR member 12, partial [Dinochytrium kinnereticum]
MIGAAFESLAVLYRASLFSIGGYNQFSRFGYLSNAEKFTPGALDVDLKGKVAIVTGANAGLGKSVAMELAKRECEGATVHMVCRDQGRGQTARDEIAEASSNPNIILEVVDVSRPAQLKEFAQKFLAREKAQINILVNNAGILPNERRETPDGIESTFATNTIGTYYLTKLLMPVLVISDSPRVISVSSGGMYNKRLDTGDLQSQRGKFDGVIAYAQTK